MGIAMKLYCCSIVYFCIKLSVIETVTTVTYSITRDISKSYLSQQMSFHTAGSFSLSACTNLCTYHNACISALNDEKAKQCYLFTSVLNVSSSEESTEVTYIESHECRWIQPSSGDCCYAANVECLNPSSDQMFTDCQDAFDHGERISGGIYSLSPESMQTSIRAVCMFDSQSGWTVIQRRLNGSVDFYRGWDDYVDGFGDLNGEYWIGLENIHHLSEDNRQLSVYLEAHDGESRTANYTFYIDGADTDYLLHVSDYVGDAGDAFIGGSQNHNNMKFSTFDKDNDESSSDHCAQKYQGAWWYNGCHNSNLNGVWYEDGQVTATASGASWKAWKGHGYSYKTIYMKLGR